MASDPSLERAAKQDQANQLQFVVAVSLRWWLMIVVSTCLCSIGLGVWGLFHQQSSAVYEAQTDLAIKQSAWEKGLLQRVGGVPLVPTQPKEVMNRVLPGLAEEVARVLVQHDVTNGGAWGDVSTEDEYQAGAVAVRSALEVSDVPEAGIIRIRVDGSTEEEARRIAEYTARVFVDRARRLQLQEEQETYELVKQQVEDVRARLTEAEQAEWAFQKQIGFRTKGQLADDMTSMKSDLVEAKAAQEQILAEMNEIEEKLRLNNARLPQVLGQVSNSVVDKLFDELDELLQQEVALRIDFTPEYEGLQLLREEIAAKEQAILEALREMDAGAGGGTSVWQEQQDLRTQYMHLQLELTKVQITERTLEARLRDLVENLPELANQDFAYRQLTERTDQLRGQFNKLIETEFEISSSIDRNFGQVVRQNPVTASVLAPPGGTLKLFSHFIVGGLVGLLIGFGLAIMLDAMDTSIRTIDEVKQYIGLEVIGTIPQMRFGKGKNPRRRRGTLVAATDESEIDACIVTQYDPKSPISESYRALRTNFQFATIRKKPKTIMVTSAVPGEGKTTTAVNMAVTMADSGMRVLIIDTDLRRPNVHRVLKMERGPGLADVLRSGLGFRTVMRPTRVENMWIISSGRVPPNPSELIGSERMREFMREVGEEFDVVVCDAPSILVVTDPVLLGTRVDTVVLVVAVNRARRETILRARKLLDAGQSGIAGVVLNGIEATRRHYYYYYYYYDDAARGRQRRWYHL